MADEKPKIVDRRAASQPRASRLIVPTSAQARAITSGRLPAGGIEMPPIGDTNRLSRQGRGSLSEQDEMRLNRKVAGLRKKAAGPGGHGGADITFATGRTRDPMFYWRQNNIPYDVTRDEELKKIRAFCNTPEAPIWMGDYSFKPIGEVQSGDEVMGWVYNVGPNGHKRKKLVRTKVLATKRRMAPEVVRVTMESGRTIRCTPDHMWANPHYSPSAKPDANRGWQQPEYKPAYVGSQLVHVIDPTVPLESEKERLTAAWLAGIYDGEGCGNEIAQSEAHNPGVCQRIKDELDVLGLPWTAQHDRIFIRQAGQGYRDGAQQDLVNFLNWTDPVRRVTVANDKAILRRPGGGKDRVVSIESEGAGEVVSMETETGNYVAWGYASKNCRILYMTHPIVAACIDIFSKFPLQGMDFECKDDQLTDFYGALFFDELDYKNYLLDMGREYWITGEAWPLGSWNEMLGVWDDDELLNPDDVEVERSPFIKDPRFLIRLPETLRKVLQERSPRWEYDALMRSYPELAQYAGENTLMPVSNVLLKQLKFKGDTFHKRGLPILMRGFRAIVQEEMLNAAMDAIADRLYTPLILAKLGASASDLGTDSPWIPTQGDLGDFEEALDAALAGDFRILVHHFATSMEPVFGRENMPDMSGDFDRIEDRILQVFGLSRTILQGADSGETYAADALNRDVVTQLLTHYQRTLQEFYTDRALIVAEAQEHFDYDVRNGQRFVKMEEILEIDEETGEHRIVEQPKLLVPDLKFDTMTLQDEQQERAFREGLVEAGIPIPIRKRIMGTGYDFEDMIDESIQEKARMVVAEQEARRETYKQLRDANLPIPQDLLDDFRPKAAQAQVPAGGQDALLPALGDPQATPVLAPTPDDIAAGEDEDEEAQVPEQMGQVIPMVPPSRPPESDEQRAGMPKPAGLRKQAIRVGVREATLKHYEAIDNSLEVDAEGNPVLEAYRPEGKFGAPKHIGMRRFVEIEPVEEDAG